jgi:hypothetical protein
MFKFLCAHPQSGRIVNQLKVAIKWKKKKEEEEEEEEEEEVGISYLWFLLRSVLLLISVISVVCLSFVCFRLVSCVTNVANMSLDSPLLNTVFSNVY